MTSLRPFPLNRVDCPDPTAIGAGGADDSIAEKAGFFVLSGGQAGSAGLVGAGLPRAGRVKGVGQD
jgi:hypothetical protein